MDLRAFVEWTVRPRLRQVYRAWPEQSSTAAVVARFRFKLDAS